MSKSKEMSMNGRGGQVIYLQTNEVKNCIIHYHRSANGALAEVERCRDRRRRFWAHQPNTYHIARPNHFKGAGSVRLTPDRRFLFATNGGGNSVSPTSAVDKEGWPDATAGREADGEHTKRWR